jgi:ppGpp synthetase/RelA/SpoT-type nucleotidyltranferase
VLPQPSQLREWHRSRSAFFERSAEDVGQAVARFLTDWAIPDGVRVIGSPETRVKSVERLWSKLLRKLDDDPRIELAQFDDLLGSDSLVGDLVGARFVVRGLTDLAVLLRSMKENGFLSEIPFENLNLDNKNLHPSVTGYRAVHVNICQQVTIRGETLRVPVEVQIKTGLQDHWGTFTHDTAYEKTELHEDPHFVRLRELQRLLADSLDVADQLNRSVEQIYEEFVTSRRIGDETASLEVDGVLTIINDVHGVVISVESASRLLDVANFCGVRTISELRAVVDNQEALDRRAAQVEGRDGEAPELIELLVAELESRILP